MRKGAHRQNISLLIIPIVCLALFYISPLQTCETKGYTYRKPSGPPECQLFLQIRLQISGHCFHMDCLRLYHPMDLQARSNSFGRLARNEKYFHCLCCQQTSRLDIPFQASCHTSRNCAPYADQSPVRGLFSNLLGYAH
jgi:hypothetical protein